MIYDDNGVLDLEAIARQNLGDVRRSLSTPRLYEEIIKNREGHVAHLGPVVVRTGHHAERSPQDSFFVPDDGDSERKWLATELQPMPAERFERLAYRVLAYLQHKDIYVQDCLMGVGLGSGVPLRVVTETAWHSLLARNLLWPVTDPEQHETYAPAFTIVHVPGFLAVPELDGTATSAFVILNGAHNLVLMGGTSYAGELRSAISTAARYLHDPREVLPLTCAASVSPDGDVAAFLGRTGNGKTALVCDPDRRLVGDHHCGWGPDGLVSFQRGCYARVLELTKEKAPAVHVCTRKFGTVLENVGMDNRTRRVDLQDGRMTENTRAVYPMAHVPGAIREGRCGHPKNLFLLTRDTQGVLPPIVRLDPDQAVFAFLTSYLASLSDTEARPGDVRPSATKPAAAAAAAGPPAFDLGPVAYAKLFMERIQKHQVQCWFVNTGWVGEPAGQGDRIDIDVTRAMVRAAIAGELDDVPYERDPLFLFEVPKQCPGVPAEILDPREAAVDKGEYEVRANRLALDFIAGFERFGDAMPESVRKMVESVPISMDTLDVLEDIGFSI